VIYFGYKFGEEPLRSSNITDSNPFNSPQVREAMNLALDRDAIRQIVMRGHSIPTGVATPPFVNGWTEELDAYPARTTSGRARSWPRRAMRTASR
jgi:peptide/nickel transport system substrate-binding protein